MNTLRKLQANESSEYFKRYSNLVETENIVAGSPELTQQTKSIITKTENWIGRQKGTRNGA